MSYVDRTQSRERRQIHHREDFAAEQVRPGDFLYDVKNNPYFSLSVAFGLGIPASWVSLWTLAYFGTLAGLPVAVLPMVPSALLSLRGLLQLGSWGRRGGVPKVGLEKQLLLTIAATDGITPVEAALETSLSVDEAEELLTRLADRGHLSVQGRDGVLVYAMPHRGLTH